MQFCLKVWFGVRNVKSISKLFSIPEKSVRLCLILLLKRPTAKEITRSLWNPSTFDPLVKQGKQDDTKMFKAKFFTLHNCPKSAESPFTAAR